MLALLTAVLVSVSILPITAGAGASDNGTLIVHFYNGENEYDYSEWNGVKDVTWGAYYWIDVGRIVPATAQDTEFSRDDNIGRYFTISLNATETAAVKSGKKLGLIMVRAYTDDTNTFIPYWCGNKGKDLSADRLVAIELDATNTDELWIIAGDKNNYTSLESAKSAFERIESARFNDFGDIDIQTTSPVTTDTNYKITAITDAINDEVGTEVASGKVSTTWNDGFNSYVSCNIQNFDWNADYMLWMDGYAFPTAIDKARLFLSDKFKQDCLPQDANDDGEVETQFGCIYTSNATTFRFWGPISTDVVVNFYKTGDETDKTLARSAVEMVNKGKGIWEAEVDGNLDGIYYTFSNYVYGEINEVCDPYASAVGINGNRAMVCDLDATDPDGWDEDKLKAEQIRNENSLVPVIWEIHMRDFSISADSGITYKGKYLAFTEDNTTAKGDSSIKTGISYLKELGATYVHLNPVYDFATVDEEYNNNIDYATPQNWGYDPKNYNVPDGSYSTNAEDGEVRINEFKQMVQALHEAGIGVIMDVVYNHSYTSNGWFGQSVPGYYYRQELSGEAGSFGYQSWTTNALGAYNLSDGSGCSNEFASEREMYRSYMINSVKYWAEEYHIDGFRFDLMGCHDTETMNKLRSAINTLDGGEGILLYGEPWAAASCGLDPATGLHLANMDNVDKLSDDIKIFNSTVREAIKGNNSPGKGFVNGDSSKGNDLLIGLQGGIWNGKCKTEQSILYTTSHDNYTLWDQLVKTTMSSTTPTAYSEGNELVKLRNKMAAAMTLMGKGTSFILAGEEIARTKYGNHNSYNAQDRINAFDYYRQVEHGDLFDWYKKLIELRTERFTSMCRADVSMFNGIYSGTQTAYFGAERINATDEYSKVMIICNAGSSSHSISFDDGWTLIGDSKTGIDFDSTTTIGNGMVTVPAYTTYILVQK